MMQHNVCGNCGAKDGRAGNLFSRPGLYTSFCGNCSKTLDTNRFCVDACLNRTDRELEKTAQLLNQT
jgi:ribosomal protein L32